MARTSAMILLGAALAAGLPAPAAAQQPADPKPAATEEDKAAARELANKGFELYQAGNYKEAIQYFKDADARFHAPTLVIMQASANEKAGNLIEARGLYSQITREPPGPDATKEFKKAYADAEDALGKIKGRIPKLKIVVKGGKPDKLQITIDNIPVPASIMERPMEQNPGVRKVVATIATPDGGRSVYQTVTLREGRIKQITIVLRPGGGALVQAPPGDEPTDGEETGGSFVPAGIAFGVGGAGIALGVVTGVLWLNEKDIIKETCPKGDPCDPVVQPHIDKAGKLGIAAIIGMATGGVGVTLGTILAVTRSSKKKPAAEAEAGVTAVQVGPGSILVRGAF